MLLGKEFHWQIALESKPEACLKCAPAAVNSSLEPCVAPVHCHISFSIHPGGHWTERYHNGQGHTWESVLHVSVTYAQGEPNKQKEHA